MSARKIASTAYRGLLIAFFALVIAHAALDLGHPVWWDFLPLLLAYVVLVVAHRWGGAPDSPRAAREPVEVEPPVTGRWTALNSPANHTPSHHTHAYGQTFAIDVVAEPGPGSRPAFRALWPLARRNADFPAFGAPLHAVADATVVRATDRARDHLSRNSLPALAYLMILEANVRDLLGAGRILGNHLVLDLGDGVHAVYAHLRRGSLTVREGDRVHAGQVLAQVGNSGNSTEPHLHFQLMDGPDADTARGIPFTWRGTGVPRNNEVFDIPARQAGARA
ncbi:M23 family metallopeptidase [Streptomyces lusitanus]|uniref:M23 family metallopeptidase n=1 Tax=Streptomyces lusitanus TaxID=68232 RepID=A0ABU3K031_9ACTN|nr:M23 family metallopeptidase [Streptomyces lusitanus]